jgi:hypothetical protein
MRLSAFAVVTVPLVIALTCAAVYGADRHERSPAAPTATLPPVEVRALRDPVEKPYRKIVSGMDLFEQKRSSLAPDATLRFRLLPRRRETNMEGIALTIAGNRIEIPVSVAADNTFTLPRSERALKEDAVVTPDRQARTMTWRTDIRTPGVPPNARRLGDLRLECLVGMEAGLVSNLPSFLEFLSGLMNSPRYCDQREPHYLFFADRPLWSVTLIAGNRREILSVDQLYAGISRDPMSARDLQYCDCEILVDRTYYAPLGDPTWPNDTLIVFDYMDDGGVAAASDPPPAASDGRLR